MERAALVGCGIHNVLVEIDGPEVPILDGSAAPFVAGIMARGVRELDAPMRCIEILETVEVRTEEALARLAPAAALEIDFGIDFVDAAIGRARLIVDDEERWAALREAHQGALDGAGLIPIGSAPSRSVSEPEFAGVVVRADGSIEIRDLP